MKAKHISSRTDRRILSLMAGLCLAFGSAALGQDQPPVITKQPQSQILAAGTEVRFSVELEPNPLTPTYQWYRASSAITNETNAALVLSNVGNTQSGCYYVAVSNAAGSTNSDQAGLTVVADGSVSGSLNTRVLLRVNYSGPTLQSRQWRLNGNDIAGARSVMYIITNAQPADVGQYSVVVSNQCGVLELMLPPNIVDPTFTKITTGPLVTDKEGSQFSVWLDYDGDGFLDVFVPNSAVPAPAVTTDSFYRNDGQGGFTKLPATVFPAPRTISIAGAVGDYDNDGFIDLFVSHWQYPDSLYRNVAGTFVPQSGLLITNSHALDHTGSPCWADYDRDGFIDLFLPQGVYGEKQNDQLFRNKGDGTFDLMTADRVGEIVNDQTGSGAAAWVDYDADGWPDLWVGAQPNNLLYHNDRDGTFSRVQLGSLTLGKTFSGGWGDYDNDGFPDLFVGAATWSRWINPSNSLHHNLGGLAFTNVAPGTPLDPAVESVGASGAWGDLDNDGWLDLFVANYGVTNQFFRNNRDGTFSSVDLGSPIRDGGRDGNQVWVDYDNDGCLDLFMTSGDASPEANLLYRNNGNTNGWLKVSLEGTASNRSAIGAKVRVWATICGESFWQMRELFGDGFCPTSPALVAHFGLGDATLVDTVRIEWPSGIVQELHGVAPRQLLTVIEPPQLVAQGAGSFQIRCWKGQQFEVQTSGDLSGWTSLGTVTNETGTLVYTDADAGSNARRFYRVVAK